MKVGAICTATLVPSVAEGAATSNAALDMDKLDHARGE